MNEEKPRRNYKGRLKQNRSMRRNIETRKRTKERRGNRGPGIKGDGQMEWKMRKGDGAMGRWGEFRVRL